MILRAGWIVPVVRPPIRDGYIAIEDGRILALGSADDLGRDERAAATHLPDCAILPGFINAHCHLELTAYAGRFRPQGLWSWFSELIAARREEGAAEREFAAAMEGMRQSLRAGVTHIGDITRSPKLRQPIADAPVHRTVFIELLALARDEPRTVDELRWCIEHAWEDGKTRPGISPHTPYTVKIDEVRAAIALAGDRFYIPWAMHFAETPEEIEWLRGSESALPEFFQAAQQAAGVVSPRCSPAEYLRRLAPADPGLIVHGNYLDGEALAVMREQRHTLVYCPRAHHYYGHRHHPWLRAIAAGVPVALATDSAASNQSLSLLDEVRFVRAAAHAAGLSDSDLLEMITIVPAAELGRGGGGGIWRGFFATFNCFSIPAATDDPLAAILDSGDDPAAVFVAGSLAYRDEARMSDLRWSGS
ncbi:MAG: amidohydrolase family protein [Phycisphaerae bacterium]|nr:amidohydrolase family protein [Phycisphaerae bacterium]